MKKQHLKLVLLLALAFLTIAPLSAENYSDGINSEENSEVLFGNIVIDDLKGDIDLYTLDEEVITVDHYEKAQDPATVVALAKAMIAIGAGLGFGNDQTLWCFHAAYYLTLASLASSTLYGVLGAVYNGLSYSDSNYKESIVDFQLQFLMFTAISQYIGWNLIYGLSLAYGVGSEDNGNFKNDISRITAAFVVGFHLMFTASFALAMHTNLFAWRQTTYKIDGEDDNEFKQDSTVFLLNKASIFAISLLFTL